MGSGGPWIKGDRASTSYLVWVGEQAKILVDMGGGAFLRFGQAQAKLRDLSMIAISHLHPDHVSDLPALLWLSQQIRQEPLRIGPLLLIHASPSIVGRTAQGAAVGRLILSHIGQFDLDPAIAEVKKSYTGPLTVGADLQCTAVH